VTGRISGLGRTYGFIRAADDTQYFFHDSDVVGERDIELKVGDRVTFEVVEPMPAKGPRACNVSFLSAGNSAQEATQ
jgi:cold shock CspA family protein